MTVDEGLQSLVENLWVKGVIRLVQAIGIPVLIWVANGIWSGYVDIKTGQIKQAEAISILNTKVEVLNNLQELWFSGVTRNVPQGPSTVRFVLGVLMAECESSAARTTSSSGC